MTILLKDKLEHSKASSKAFVAIFFSLCEENITQIHFTSEKLKYQKSVIQKNSLKKKIQRLNSTKRYNLIALQYCSRNSKASSRAFVAIFPLCEENITRLILECFL